MGADHPDALAPDPCRVALGFDRRAERYHREAFIEPMLRERLLERLALVRLEPRRVLDLGCADGESSFALARRYRRSQVIAADRSPGMLAGLLARRGWRLRRRVRPLLCDAAALPLADGSIDLVFSSLLLHWHGDPGQVFSECRRVLRPGGLLLFNTFGPDTLRELRSAWRTVDEAAHVNLFLDMHDLGDALQRAGLAAPVMDTETLAVTHETTAALFRDLRATTPGNVLAGRPRGLLGRARHARLLEELEQSRRDGRLQTTLEVVYGHAWGREPPAERPGTGTGQEVRVPLSSLRRTPRG